MRHARLENMAGPASLECADRVAKDTPPPLYPSCEASRHPHAQSHAGDVEEQLAVDAAEVDSKLAPTRDHRARLLRRCRHATGARQDVGSAHSSAEHTSEQPSLNR